MNELRYNISFLDLDYHQAYHSELIRKSLGMVHVRNVQLRHPSFWDTALCRTGDILVSLGEKLQHNRTSWQLSEECR